MSIVRVAYIMIAIIAGALIVKSPQDILNLELEKGSKVNLSKKNSITTLAYITPWNGKGYDVGNFDKVYLINSRAKF